MSHAPILPCSPVCPACDGADLSDAARELAEAAHLGRCPCGSTATCERMHAGALVPRCDACEEAALAAHCAEARRRERELEPLLEAMHAVRPAAVRPSFDYGRPGCPLCGETTALRPIFNSATFGVAQCTRCAAIKAHLIESEHRWYTAESLRAALLEQAANPSRLEADLTDAAEYVYGEDR